MAGQAGLPPFPTWPPPNGGAPFTARPETGPIAAAPNGTTFPAGSYIGAGGVIINPQSLAVVRTVGALF